MENEEWATGPPGRRGPWAAGPSGRRAAGPWRAVGRGPLGRGPAFSKTLFCSGIINLLFDGLTYDTRGHLAHWSYFSEPRNIFFLA